MSQLEYESIESPQQPVNRLQFLLRALRHRNYRLFFVGQSLSLVGFWISQVTVGWLVYRLTGSALLLGVVTFAGQVPAFLLSPLGGVMVDRWDRRLVLLVTQGLMMVSAGILAFMTFTELITFPAVLILAIMDGIGKAFDIPARQALVVALIEDRADLSNAIALNSSMFHGARLIGPSVAGILIAAFGEAICFALGSLGYVFIITALLMIRLKPAPRQGTQRHVLHDLAEGLRYVIGHPTIRTLLILVAVISLCGSPHQMLLPVFAKDVLSGSSITLGLLMGSSGLGALGGAVFLASRPSAMGLTRIVAAATMIFGVALIAFGLSTSLPISMILMAVVGFGMLLTMAGSNTVMQTVVTDRKRGRVMSLFVMAFMGMMPLGGLIAGQATTLIGAPATVIIGGTLVLTISAVFFTKTAPLESAVAAAARPSL